MELLTNQFLRREIKLSLDSLYLGATYTGENMNVVKEIFTEFDKKFWNLVPRERLKSFLASALCRVLDEVDIARESEPNIYRNIEQLKQQIKIELENK